MTAREILKMLYKDGWREVPNRTKGSHIAYSGAAEPQFRRFGNRGDAEPETAATA